ncbi:MAG: hypothetical protein JWQ28_822 [Pedobacter sp.]|nr:hypothetical protein [Pedobacter sp.]
MKRIFLSAAFLAFAGLTTVKANTVKLTTVSIQQDSTTKTPVKVDALPEAVKTALKSDKYKTYTPSSAYLVTAANKDEWYEVEISNKEGQTASLKIAKDGVVVE